MERRKMVSALASLPVSVWIVAQVNTYKPRGDVEICFKLHTFTLMSI
jgi:hypothetical protein